MTVATTAGPWWRTPVLLLVALLALAGCTEDDPRVELEEALADTLGTEVAFELLAEADRAALDALGDAAGDAAQFLADFRVVGTREPDGPTVLAVELAPGQPVLEAVVLPGGELRLRTGLGELLGLAGGSPAEALEPELDRRGVSEQQRTALLAGFEGDWIAISDAGGLGGVLDESGASTDAGTLDLDRVMEAVEVTGDTDDGDRRRIEVLVDVGRLLGDVEGVDDLEEPVSAVVEIADGLVHRIRVDLADGLGEDQGSVRLELLLSDHGDAEVSEPPEVEATVTTEELEELLELLGQG
jgi:hypothetical protein